MSQGYRIQAFNEADGPVAEVGLLKSLAQVGGHLGHFCEDYETVLVLRIEDDGDRTLVMRYDVDGFDL